MTYSGSIHSEAASLVYRFIGLHIPVILCKIQDCIKIKVKRQYPNLLQKFLDFCKFEGLDVEQKAIKFSYFARSKSQEEVEDLIIRFILSQKERIDKKEITSGTLRNYIKAIKLFCRMNRINISSSALPLAMKLTGYPNLFIACLLPTLRLIVPACAVSIDLTGAIGSLLISVQMTVIIT